MDCNKDAVQKELINYIFKLNIFNTKPSFFFIPTRNCLSYVADKTLLSHQISQYTGAACVTSFSSAGFCQVSVYVNCASDA